MTDLFILKHPFDFLTCLISGIRASFDAMDLNHDGKLSANELRRACKQLGILLTREELQEIIMEADTSSNVFILRGIYITWVWSERLVQACLSCAVLILYTRNSLPYLS